MRKNENVEEEDEIDKKVVVVAAIDLEIAVQGQINDVDKKSSWKLRIYNHQQVCCALVHKVVAVARSVHLLLPTCAKAVVQCFNVDVMYHLVDVYIR